MACAFGAGQFVSHNEIRMPLGETPCPQPTLFNARLKPITTAI